MVTRGYDLRKAMTPQGPYDFPVVQVTDCASLYDHVMKESGLAKEERTRYAALIIKEDCAQPQTSLRWSPTGCQLGDCLTTKSQSPLKEQVRQLMKGSLTWREPSSSE